MKASNILKKQIIIELLALLVLLGSIVYAIYAIRKSDRNEIASYDGVVTVLDDSKFEMPKRTSDGVGFNSNGVTFTVTNNRDEKIGYKFLFLPNIHDDTVLDNMKIGLDDVYILHLADLDRENGWYVLDERMLDAGYTKIHSVKIWYDLNSKMDLPTDIQFKYKILIK